MKKDIVLVQVKPVYQRELFERIVKKYHSSLKASKILKIPASSIRGYKNLYFDSIPKSLLLNILKKLEILKENSETNILRSFNRNKQINICLNKGRDIRKKYLAKLKSDMPNVQNIIHENQLNLEKWLEYYLPLASIGCRKINISDEKDFLVLSYRNFTKHGFKEFSKRLPKKIIIDNNFMYFFGLWCGDRSGGKRFGICNKNNEIITYTEDFLKKYNQNVEKILYIQKSLPVPNIPFDKIFVIDKDIKGWVISVHETNGVLSSFFHYLQSNIDFLLRNYNSYAFFAGLFDAEGNVSLHNQSFRWACKNEKLINIYRKFLKKLDLYHNYDGHCIISYNKNIFYKMILPYMKHTDKINLVQLMCAGKGDLLHEHYKILDYLRDTPEKTTKEIAKALKKNKVYSELRILKDFGFVSYEGYPHVFRATPKGLKSIGENYHYNTSKMLRVREANRAILGRV